MPLGLGAVAGLGGVTLMSEVGLKLSGSFGIGGTFGRSLGIAEKRSVRESFNSVYSVLPANSTLF